MRSPGPALAPRLLVVAAALTILLGMPGTAAGATPCWKRLINDWYDGRIDKAYPAHCYRDAIDQLPEDVEAYSSAREDISRALQAAITRSGGGPLDPGTPIAPPPGQKKRSADGGEAAPANGDDPVGGPLGPNSADELPIPLLILAGLALLLLAAAGASFIMRRMQERRVPAVTSPAPPPEQQP